MSGDGVCRKRDSLRIIMTPLIGGENLFVDPEIAVPRMERSTGSGLQSRSSAGSPGTSGAEKAGRVLPTTKTTGQADTPGLLRGSKQAPQAQEPESRPMEPSRVIEVQFFKDGFLGKKLSAKHGRPDSHIDLKA